VKKPFKLSIIIPTFNRKESLQKVLEDLEKQDTRSHESGIIDITVDIIVVVDGSTDGTAQMLRDLHPKVTVIEGNGHWWWTRSVNEGCKRAVINNADAVLLLNDDVRLADDCIDNLLQAYENNPGAIIGALNVTDHRTNRIFFSGVKQFRWWSARYIRYHSFLSPYPPNLSGLHKTIVLPGRGLLIPTGVFKRIGYFDQEGLPQYKADYDFVFRAHKHHVETLISWDARVFVNVETTGGGATFTRQSITRFASSFFKRNTRTNLLHNFTYYRRHFPVWGLPLLPVTAIITVFRQFSLFIKGKKY
jgi:GT2 family glycosyltransferase